MRDNISHTTKLTQAKSKLMLESPYFGTLVTTLGIEKNNNIASVRPLGDLMEYNEAYLEALSLEEVMTILANMAMHQALFHTERGVGKVGSIWSLASDYAINGLLIENGFTLPPLSNYSSRFEHLYAEQIYAILLEESNLSREELESDTQKSREIDHKKIPQELLSQEGYEMMIRELGIKMAKQKTLPKGIERFVEGVEIAQISWRDELYRYVNTHAKSDYRIFPANKKHLYRGITLPSIYGEELNIAVAIDTSASIDDRVLRLFLAELYEIMQIFPHYIIELIECDAKIQNIQRLRPLERLEPIFKGGGGTDFRPVFEYLKQSNEEIKFLIYFTDGKGSFPNYIPMIDTLWVMSEESEIPFGEVLMIRDKTTPME
jgi:predicted metal-dependent peptidase